MIAEIAIKEIKVARKKNHLPGDPIDIHRWNVPYGLLGSWESTDEKRKAKQSTFGMDPTTAAFDKLRERQRQQSARRLNGL